MSVRPYPELIEALNSWDGISGGEAIYVAYCLRKELNPEDSLSLMSFCHLYWEMRTRKMVNKKEVFYG